VEEPERPTEFICWICSKSISLQQLEQETTDALGSPVHKTCYSKMLLEEKAKRKAAGRSR
jgi:hypothetical protein